MLATSGLTPSLTLLLDINPEVGLNRAALRSAANKNSNNTDAFEAEELAFHKRVREGFLYQAENNPEPFALIDASQNQNQVFAQALEFFYKFEQF